MSVVKDGVDLDALNATLLAKIEELTLYIIQLEKKVKRLNDQQADVNELKKLVKQLLKD